MSGQEFHSPVEFPGGRDTISDGMIGLSIPALRYCMANQRNHVDRDDEIETGVMTGVTFSLRGTGIGLPDRRVSSASLDREIGKREGWLEENCGVRERYVCGAEAQDELAATAAREAIAEANIQAAHIDLLIFASAIPKHSIPATSPLIARHLCIPNGGCATLDVNSTCLSFLSGFDVATSMIAAGRYKCALVVSSEIASRALPWRTDPATAGLFGDGAAAAVLTAPEPNQASRIRAILFETYHDGYEACQLAAGGTAIDFHREPERFAAGSFFQMSGRDLFKLTAGKFPEFVDRLLATAKWTHKDVDVVVPHQASPLALAHLVKRCGFPKDRVVDIVASHGNQVAASIPSALHFARRQGLINRGSKVLLLGTSAGVSFGGIAIEM
jgi:3-oxoacyl-[acyl-carrier-protein] synthase-3